jgi:septum formation protein
VVPGALTGLILASASPQRRAILTQLGIDFTVRPADVDELDVGDPETVARANAIAKATAEPGPLVLGVDTLVTLDGQIFGKPADAERARATLATLAGRTHRVVSGIALARDGQVQSDVEVTEVTFTELSAAEIAEYVETREWEGRAGGYAIQGRGSWLVSSIAGDYQNVVGLPVPALRRLLASAMR